MKTSQTLTLNSEKKHSVRYDALPDTPFAELYMTSVYVSKQAFGATSTYPKTIIVTVEAS